MQTSEPNYCPPAFETDEHLNCPICMNVFNDAVRVCDGGHVYCYECIQQHVQASELNGEEAMCPECRGEIIQSRNGDVGARMPMLNSIIESANAACSFKCGCVFPLRAMNAHKQECVRAPVKCPFFEFGCKWTGPRCDVHSHIQEAIGTHVVMQSRWMEQSHQELKELVKDTYASVMTKVDRTNSEMFTFKTLMTNSHKAHKDEARSNSRMAKQIAAIADALDATMQVLCVPSSKRKAEDTTAVETARKRLKDRIDDDDMF